MTLFVISWFLVGFITLISIFVCDMRGKEFDKYYFDDGGAIASLVLILFGYISPFIYLFAVFMSNIGEKPFTKLIYKFVNIGVKKEDKNEEEQNEMAC